MTFSKLVIAPLCFTLVGARISPGLHPASDKKFMGKDYPDDGRAFDVSKQGFKPPYPSVQESDEFDKDYVKDENKDNGEWSAQMEYDMARAKVRRAKADLAKAQGMTAGQSAAYDKAYKKALAAGATAAEARKKAQAAGQKYADAKAAEQGAEGNAAGLHGKHITPGTVDESDLVAAKERLAKEEFQFKICEEQLEKAKQALKDALAARAAKENEEANNAAAQQKAHNDQAGKDAAEAERLKGETAKAAAAEKAAADEDGKLTHEEYMAQQAADAAKKKVNLQHMSVAELQAHIDKIEEELRVAEYVLKFFRQHGGPPAEIPDHIRHPPTSKSSINGGAGGAGSGGGAGGGGGSGSAGAGGGANSREKSAAAGFSRSATVLAFVAFTTIMQA